MKSAIPFVFIVLLAGACIEHRSKHGRIASSESSAEITAETKLKLKGARVYEGTIPCADCSGIDQHLVLRGDTLGVFRLTETFRDATEDGDEVMVTTGHWKFYRNKKSEKVLFLSEGSMKDSTRFQRYLVSGNAITQLDFDGKWIESPANYTLKLVSKR